MDRSLHQRRRPPLRRLRSRILRQILRRQRLRRRHQRRYGRWRCPSLCYHGFLHMHEDSRDHTAQDRRAGGKATEHVGYIHGYLQERGYSRDQQGCQRSCHSADYELGIAIRVLTISRNGYSKCHGKGRRPETQLLGEDPSCGTGWWIVGVESAHRSHPRGDAEQDGRPKSTQELDCGQDVEVYLFQQWAQGLVQRCDASHWIGRLANHLHGGVGGYVRPFPPSLPTFILYWTVAC